MVLKRCSSERGEREKRFYGDARSFNQPLNKWNVSNDVTYMRRMFDGADSFNQPLHAPWYHDEESDSE